MFGICLTTLSLKIVRESYWFSCFSELGENKQKKLGFLRSFIRSYCRQRKRYHTDTIVIIARMFWKLIEKVGRKLSHFPNNVGNFFDAPDFQLSKCILPSRHFNLFCFCGQNTSKNIYIKSCQSFLFGLELC